MWGRNKDSGIVSYFSRVWIPDPATIFLQLSYHKIKEFWIGFILFAFPHRYYYKCMKYFSKWQKRVRKENSSQFLFVSGLKCERNMKSVNYMAKKDMC
jgi:hypothetical protein